MHGFCRQCISVYVMRYFSMNSTANNYTFDLACVLHHLCTVSMHVHVLVQCPYYVGMTLYMYTVTASICLYYVHVYVLCPCICTVFMCKYCVHVYVLCPYYDVLSMFMCMYCIIVCVHV